MRHDARLARIEKRVQATKPEPLEIVVTHGGIESYRVTVDDYQKSMGAGRWVKLAAAGVPFAHVQGDLLNAVLPAGQ